MWSSTKTDQPRLQNTAPLQIVGICRTAGKNGQVLFARHADENLQDVVTNGIGIVAADRREVALKNALVELADKFSKEVKFKHHAGNYQRGKRPALGRRYRPVLQLGQAVRIYRKSAKTCWYPLGKRGLRRVRAAVLPWCTQLEIAGSPLPRARATSS